LITRVAIRLKSAAGDVNGGVFEEIFMRPRTLLLSLMLLTAATPLQAADWPFFRGPERDGKSEDTKIPLEWGKDKNVRWRAKLPRPGNGSPVVASARVFVTCAEDRKGVGRSLYCFDRLTGKQLWVKTVTWSQADPSHDTNPYCAPSPATDGQRVVVWHGSAGLYCYDLAGNELWHKDLGPFRHIWGYASSPLIHGDRVYLNCGPGTRSFVVALNKNTGEILWQTDEPGGAPDKDATHPNWLGSWSSGVVTQVGDREQLVVFQPLHVNGYDLQSGKILWTCGGAGLLAYTDVVLGDVEGLGKVGVAMAGYGGKAIGFKPGGSGDTTTSHRLWQSTTNPPQRIGSGIILGKHLFIINETGPECIDVATGASVWKKGIPGTFWASLVSTPGRLYATNQQGKTIVFAPDPAGFKQLAVNDLEEKINATPAVSDGQLFIRTWEALYCIGE
jgi:outer membrane protein assembly factor BamB